MNKIYFSLDLANDLISKVKPKINELIQLRDELELLDNTKIEFDNDNIENLLLEVELNKSFHDKNLKLYALLEELIRLGCIIRDIENIEIDFYSKLDGKDIVFCWDTKDDQILYWHDLNDSCEKKRPIKEIEQKYIEKLVSFK
jgi:hypothetical protein